MSLSNQNILWFSFRVHLLKPHFSCPLKAFAPSYWRVLFSSLSLAWWNANSPHLFLYRVHKEILWSRTRPNCIPRPLYSPRGGILSSLFSWLSSYLAWCWFHRITKRGLEISLKISQKKNCLWGKTDLWSCKVNWRFMRLQNERLGQVPSLPVPLCACL